MIDLLVYYSFSVDQINGTASEEQDEIEDRHENEASAGIFEPKSDERRAAKEERQVAVHEKI